MKKTLVSKEINATTRIEKMIKKENITRKREICMPMMKATHLMKMITTQEDALLFMAMNDQDELSNNEDINHEDSDEEGEVNLEGELICALHELKKLRMKNASLKEQLRESKKDLYETNGETEIISLKRQLEEARKIEEVLTNKLKEMEDICHKKEFEIVHLRKELNKTVTQLNTNLKFENSLTVLEDILSIQRSPLDKTGLGYDNSQKNIDGSANHVIPEKKETTQNYANVLKSFNCSGNTSKNAEDNRHNKYVQQKPAPFYKEMISKK
jgi:hypothetical protein